MLFRISYTGIGPALIRCISVRMSPVTTHARARVCACVRMHVCLCVCVYSCACAYAPCEVSSTVCDARVLYPFCHRRRSVRSWTARTSRTLLSSPPSPLTQRSPQKREEEEACSPSPSPSCVCVSGVVACALGTRTGVRARSRHSSCVCLCVRVSPRVCAPNQ